MKDKRIIIAALFAVVWVAMFCFAGCGTDMPSAAAQSAQALPFSVPSIFTLDEDATARNGMLTFQSDSRTTLIVSCRDATPEFLERTRSSTMTEQSLVAAYKNSGLDVTVSDLHTRSSDDCLLYTYTVHLSTQNGSTLTRKYIRITEEQVLDISCGGNVVNEDAVDLDYTALLAVLPDDP